MIRSVGVSLVSLLVFFLFAEGAIRSLHWFQQFHSSKTEDDLYYLGSLGRRVRPNATVEHYSPIAHKKVRVSTNSLGMRRSPDAPLTGSPTVLVLGDSITMSDYVDDGKEWSALLESKFPGSAFLNAGIPDTGTREQIERLRELKKQGLKFDRILLLWYLNDSRPPWSFRLDIDRSWLFQNSALYRFVIFRWNLLKLSQKNEALGWISGFRDGSWKADSEKSQKLVQDARFDWGFAWSDEHRRKTRELIGELIQEAGPVPVMIAIAPTVVQVEADLDDRPQRDFLELCKEKNIPCLDLLPRLKGVRGYYLDHCHYNEQGSEKIAEIMHEWMVSVGG